jgi:NAD(P) transhydrogenase subunit alpha
LGWLTGKQAPAARWRNRFHNLEEPPMQTSPAPQPQRIGVPRETFPGEKRVATVPDVVEKLVKLGFSVVVESGAGEAANFSDEAYRAAGADVVNSAAALWAASDIVFKVRPPSTDEVALMREGTTLIDFIWPAQNPDLMQQLAAKQATVLAIDCLPRTLSRAQKMDALTSTAAVIWPLKKRPKALAASMTAR